MDALNAVRSRWDEIFSETSVKWFARLFSTICGLIATYALGHMFPFINLMGSAGLILISVIVAGAFFVSEYLGILFFAVVIIMTTAGAQAMVALCTMIMVFFVCGNSRFMCGLATLVPLFTMNIESADSSLLSINLVYFIFFVCVFFNGKIGTNTWKYAFPIYFTLNAFNFGFFGKVTDDYFSMLWTAEEYEKMDLSPFEYFTEQADFNGAMATLPIITLLIIILVNVVICAIVYAVINIKKTNYLRLPVDVRDLIAFVAVIILMILGMFFIVRTCALNVEIGIVSIILQGLAAFIVTRPFASYDVCEGLKYKRSAVEEQILSETVSTRECGRSLPEEIMSVIDTYVAPNKFHLIMTADKVPVNAILVYGGKEIDEHYIVENVLKDVKVDREYFSSADLLAEYDDKGSISVFEKAESFTKLHIIVIEKLEDLITSSDIDGEYGRALLEYLATSIEKCSTSRDVLFIFTSKKPQLIPERLYSEGCISKVLYGPQKDSLLLNNTYRIIRAIGKGGGGQVFKAFHERLNVTVIVKKIINNFSDSRSYKAEADVLKNLKHSYLPKVYDVFEENKNFYTVMDYIPGRDMKEEVDINGSLPQKSVLNWGLQLAEAVEYLHDQKPPIIHSDIKPSNIMLTPEGNISLIDFNISLIFDKSESSIGATPGYSPIEQYGTIGRYNKVVESDSYEVDGHGVTTGGGFTTILDIDAKASAADGKSVAENQELAAFVGSGLSERSDIYSMGATIYTLLTGEKPPADFTKIKPLRECDPDISESFASVIEKAMCIDPAGRYPSVKAFAEALRNVSL